MAEIAGIVIGAAGLIALESTVEDFFQKVATWKDYGKDYEHYHLKLDIAAVAYGRWRKSVEIRGEDNITDARLQVAGPKETETAKKLLGAIATAFRDAEKRAGQPEPNKEVVESGGEASDSLVARYHALVERRQKGTGAWQKLRWVVHDKKVLTTLTERVDEYVTGLVCLFPGAVEEAQKMIATIELEELVPTDSTQERAKLVEVSNISAKVDHIMQQVVAETIQRVDERHRFLRNTARLGARAAYGDTYGKGVEKRLDGPGNYYEGNLVEGRGTRAAYGDRVDMPDFLGDQHSDGDEVPGTATSRRAEDRNMDP